MGHIEDKQRQKETCINMQGQVNEVLRADPSMNRPVWTGTGMNTQGTLRNA